jgi:ribonuclease HII
MKNLPQKTLERNHLAQGYDCVIGVDEVGMGCLAGPVVVCAMLISPAFFDTTHPELSGIRDSKLLSARQREHFVRLLRRTPHIARVVVTIPPRDVDTYNVLRAAQRGMAHAVERLVRTSGVRRPAVLVDGNRPIPALSWFQATIIGGDRRVFAISCASIFAKVHRDGLMVRASRTYPHYGFEMHKGYGTKLHYARLAQFGPSAIHRKSFRLTNPKKNSTL